MKAGVFVRDLCKTLHYNHYEHRCTRRAGEEGKRKEQTLTAFGNLHLAINQVEYSNEADGPVIHLFGREPDGTARHIRVSGFSLISTFLQTRQNTRSTLPRSPPKRGRNIARYAMNRSVASIRAGLQMSGMSGTGTAITRQISRLQPGS